MKTGFEPASDRTQSEFWLCLAEIHSLTEGLVTTAGQTHGWHGREVDGDDWVNDFCRFVGG